MAHLSALYNHISGTVGRSRASSLSYSNKLQILHLWQVDTKGIKHSTGYLVLHAQGCKDTPAEVTENDQIHRQDDKSQYLQPAVQHSSRTDQVVLQEPLK